MKQACLRSPTAPNPQESIIPEVSGLIYVVALAKHVQYGVSMEANINETTLVDDHSMKISTRNDRALNTYGCQS